MGHKENRGLLRRHRALERTEGLTGAEGKRAVEETGGRRKDRRLHRSTGS